MNATEHLPATYQQLEILDLTQERPLLIRLNVVGLLLMALFCPLLTIASASLRGTMGTLFAFTFSNLLLWLVSIPCGFIGVIIVHELIHGLFFLLFTKKRPDFGFKVIYAYAAAPTWYIPRNQFIVIGAAPLLFITLFGLILMPSIPQLFLPALLFALVFNLAGSIGDLYIIWWLLRLPVTCLVNDIGDIFTIYAATQEST